MSNNHNFDRLMAKFKSNLSNCEKEKTIETIKIYALNQIETLDIDPSNVDSIKAGVLYILEDKDNVGFMLSMPEIKEYLSVKYVPESRTESMVEELINEKSIQKEGRGKGTKYFLKRK